VRFSAQRLTLVLLIATRLIFGEFASAMPDHGAAHFDHAASAQTSSDSSCPDHASKHNGGAHDDSCCKSACSCPCLHFSALAAASLVTQALPDEARPRMPVVGETAPRVARLLRPPA
jgi:hypothetical protein